MNVTKVFFLTLVQLGLFIVGLYLGYAFLAWDLPIPCRSTTCWGLLRFFVLFTAIVAGVATALDRYLGRKLPKIR